LRTSSPFIFETNEITLKKHIYRVTMAGEDKRIGMVQWMKKVKVMDLSEQYTSWKFVTFEPSVKEVSTAPRELREWDEWLLASELCTISLHRDPDLPSVEQDEDDEDAEEYTDEVVTFDIVPLWLCPFSKQKQKIIPPVYIDTDSNEQMAVFVVDDVCSLRTCEPEEYWRRVHKLILPAERLLGNDLDTKLRTAMKKYISQSTLPQAPRTVTTAAVMTMMAMVGTVEPKRSLKAALKVDVWPDSLMLPNPL